MQNHSNWKKLKEGWPHYLEELDRMFLGVPVDGSTAFVPGQTSRAESGASEDLTGPSQTPCAEPVGSDDDLEWLEDDEDEEMTPLSVGSKRTSSNRTGFSTRNSASSPSKKGKIPAIKVWSDEMQGIKSIMRNRNALINGYLNGRQMQEAAIEQRVREQVQMVQNLAREVGVTERDTPTVWPGVLKIQKDLEARVFFLTTAVEGRRPLIETYARVDN